jgi:hypothetical protein
LVLNVQFWPSGISFHLIWGKSSCLLSGTFTEEKADVAISAFGRLSPLPASTTIAVPYAFDDWLRPELGTNKRISEYFTQMTLVDPLLPFSQKS